MNSMTGYGRGEARIDGAHCVVECASVNRKGLEVACQLPRELAPLELSIREAVQSRVSRGRINISVTLPEAAAAAGATIDRHYSRNVLRDIRDLQAELGLPGNIDINTLLNVPGVLQTCPHTAEDFRPVILEALSNALDALTAMRAREGQALQRDLESHLAHLKSLREQMLPIAPEIVRRYRDELHARIARAGIPLDANDPRLATEVALYAERCDVSEELTRLASHFEQFEEKLRASGPMGRALEFLTQEIFRELNTLGSKAGDSELTRLVVDAKVELDKIREQILNVE